MKAIVVQFALALALAAPDLLAQEPAPDALLKAVTLEVTGIIMQDRQLKAAHPAKFTALVHSKIQPLFDFSRMTQIALARNWQLATPQQQRELGAEFKILLANTYASALSTYDDQTIEFKPLQLAPGDTEVSVKTDMKQPGKERLTMDYEMQKTPAGWKVYDIKFAGVSLVTTYRETFSEIVRDRGVDGLIKSLADKNRQSSGPPRAHKSLREIAILIMSAAQGALSGSK